MARVVALTNLTFRGIIVNTHAEADGSIDVEGYDSGTMFINKYSSGGTTTYALPSLVDGTGKMFWFLNGQSTREIAVTAPSDSMMGVTETYTTLTTTSNSSGDCGFVVCDGTNYYFFAISGTWTGS